MPFRNGFLFDHQNSNLNSSHKSYPVLLRRTFPTVILKKHTSLYMQNLSADLTVRFLRVSTPCIFVEVQLPRVRFLSLVKARVVGLWSVIPFGDIGDTGRYSTV